MPHQCVRCDEMYDDGAEEIIEGCPCGGSLFFFIKEEELESSKHKEIEDLSDDERKEIEEDVKDMIGDRGPDAPVVLDLENVRVLSPGKYELDLVNLFKGEPLVFKLNEGKYMVDVAETFDMVEEEANR